MERPELEAVLRTLDSLYTGEDVEQKEKASLWLMQLQSSVFAWEVADQLLLLKRNMETSYFAAQTMQSKVRFSFNELPAETHVALRDSLLNHLCNLSSAPSPITRQLAMALADLALQMTGWDSVVTDLIHKFSSDLATLPVLLDILIVLPEEINNRSLRLGHNRRRELRDLLGKGCPSVLQFLVACLSSCPGNTEMLTRVYACLGSWVQLGNFPVDELANSILISSPFQTLQLLEVPQKLCEAATDCICSALFICEDVETYRSLAVVLQAHVTTLLPVYQAAVQSEDQDRPRCICRIFTEMAESFLLHAIHHPNTELGTLTVFDYLLECAAHPDYEIVDMTFNLWYRLSEELLKIDDSALSDLFKPYIQRLIAHLSVHCRLDEDTDPKSAPPDNDDFASFRHNVIELVRDVIFLLGSLTCFSELYSNICEPGTAWNVTEACLFIMYAIAPSIRTDESTLLPIAVPVLLSIPPDSHFAIRATTLKLVAELAEWIDQHPDTLDLVLKFLLDGLHIPPVASYAAKAVQSVCQKCKDRMAPHFAGLLQIIEAAEMLGISNEAVIGLLKGATEVLSRMPHVMITQGVLGICSLQSRHLAQILQHESPKVQPGSTSDPCVWLDRLTAVFRACVLKELPEGQLHPCKPVVEELWPVVSGVCSKFSADLRVVERVCRCVRFMVRCLGSSTVGILSPLVTLSITIYTSHHHSCFLYLGSVIVDEFGSDPSFQPGLLEMLQAYAEVAFPMLAQPTGMVNYPDTVDDMFRLCARFLQRCPIPFLSSSVASTAIQCALAASTLNHRDALTSVMKFFRDLLRLSIGEMDNSEQQLRVSAVQSFLAQNGQMLIDGLVLGFISLPTFMLSDTTEVLWELLQFAREPVCQLLKASVDKIPLSGSVCVTEEQKLWFVDSVEKCSDMEALFPIVKDLARLYR